MSYGNFGISAANLTFASRGEPVLRISWGCRFMATNDKTTTVNLFADDGSSPINASALDSASSVPFEPLEGTTVVGMDYLFVSIDHSNTSSPYEEYTNSYDIIDNRLL